MDDFQKNAQTPTFLVCAAVILTCLLSLFESASFGADRLTNSVSKTRPTLDICTRHPELFHVRALTASEGMRLIRPTGEVLAIQRFGNGEVVSGDCTRFIKSFSYGVILSNGARFAMKDLAFVPAPPAAPGAGLPHSLFVPPPNVRTIAADKFAQGKGRTMVYHFGSVLL